MSLASLAKMARGTATLDEVLEMFSALGIEMEITKIEQPAKAAALDQIRSISLPDGAKVTGLEATLKGGQKMFAVLVIPA